MNTTPLTGQPVLVVGAGIMGAGIAQVAAQAGHPVRLFDAREGAAAEALALGLVQKVVSLDAIDEAVDAVVRELLVGGPQAQAEIKKLMEQLEVGPVTSGVRELTAQTIARVRMGEEAREGFAAFLAKRPAAWVPAKND